MRAFLTGATGFIGGYVARALVARGDHVTALVRSPEKAAALKELGVTLVGGDLTEPATLDGPIRRADAVFHLAAWYQLGVTDRTGMYQVNVRGTEHVMRAAADAAVERIVYCSTIATLGIRPLGDVADETTRHAGTFGSAYEETKWQAHQKVAALAREGMPIVTVMPGGPFGPGDSSILGTMIRIYARGWLVACPFMETEFSLMHVEDLAEGIVAAHDKGRLGEDYILGGENGSLRALFNRLEKDTGIRPPRFDVPDWLVRAGGPVSPLAGRIFGQGPAILRDARASMGGSFMVSSAKAQRELGYAFRSLEDALPPVVESYKLA